MNQFDESAREGWEELQEPQIPDRKLSTDVKPPYNLDDWRIDRFHGPAPEMRWLVRDLIPLETAGALYSVGGVGKSSLALDLAVRVAIEGEIKNSWLETFPVEHGGAVVYLSGEEPESVLHSRVKSICEAIADLTSTSCEQVFNAASRKLYLANLWGKSEHLFNVKATSLEPSEEYKRIRNALHEVAQQADQVDQKLRLVIIDTRSRFSGAEGAGNALVAREVNLYERLACDLGATILILHHVTKASLYGGHSMAASRGESSFLDSLRFSIHLEALSPYTASKNGISDEDRSDYIVLSNSKQNHGKLQRAVVIRRKDFKFVKAEINASDLKADKKQKHMDEDREKVLAHIRTAPASCQQDVIRALQHSVPIARCIAALEWLKGQRMLKVNQGSRNKLEYVVSEEAGVD
jgi:RecA-family ATPase